MASKMTNLRFSKASTKKRESLATMGSKRSTKRRIQGLLDRTSLKKKSLKRKNKKKWKKVSQKKWPAKKSE